MKMSKYNILTKKSAIDMFIYNTYTGSFARINDYFFNAVKKINQGENPDNDLLTDMKRCGFVIDKSIDELAEFRELIKKQRNDITTLKIVIAPTLACNFSCIYCFEQAISGIMTESIQEKIVNFVKKKLIENNSKKVNVTWYGGEPLIAKSVINNLSSKLISLCDTYKAKYHSAIITNGYLMDKITACELMLNKIRFAQITIDGTRDTHNSRRYLKSDKKLDTYDNIVNGINLLNEKGIHVAIRMNIDQDNIESIREGIVDLSKRINNKQKTSIYVGHVFDPSSTGKCYSGTCLSKEEFGKCRLDVLQICEYAGFVGAIKNSYPKPRANYCTATLRNSFVIDPFGNIYINVGMIFVCIILELEHLMII